MVQQSTEDYMAREPWLGRAGQGRARRRHALIQQGRQLEAAWPYLPQRSDKMVAASRRDGRPAMTQRPRRRRSGSSHKVPSASSTPETGSGTWMPLA